MFKNIVFITLIINFTNNTKNSDTNASYVTHGGGIYNTGTLNIQGSTIISNNVAYNGGGLYSTGTVTFTSGNISGNTVNKKNEEDSTTGNGGGVFVANGTFTMNGANAIIGATSTTTATGGDDAHAHSNLAKNNGGGVYVGSGIFNFTQGKIIYNYAVSNGGGIYIGNGTLGTSMGSQMTDNSNVSYNGAKNGGGIYASKSVPISGNITHNTASSDGGGIYLQFREDLAVWTWPRYSISSITLSNNTASNGGGIYLSKISAGLFLFQWITIGGQINNNKASSNGGGVYVESSSSLTLSATISSNSVTNSAGAGAGVYVSNSTVTISGDVTSNTLTTGGNGAGVFVTSGTVTISNLSAIESNSGATKGGGLYIADGTVTLSGSISNNNVTARSKDIESLSVVGGGVYVGNGTFRLSGGTISGNNVINNGCGDEDVYTVNFVNTNLGLPSVYQHRSYVSGVYISSQNNAKFTYSSGTINERDNRSGSIKYIAIYNAGTSSHLSLPSSPRISGDLYFAKSTNFNTILIKNGNVNADYVNYYPKNYLLYWYQNHGTVSTTACTEKKWVFVGWAIFGSWVKRDCGQQIGKFVSNTNIICNGNVEDNYNGQKLINSTSSPKYYNHCAPGSWGGWIIKGASVSVAHTTYISYAPSILTWYDNGAKSSR